GLALDLLLDRALLDPYVYAHGVARGQAGQPLLQVAGFDTVDRIHDLPLVRESARPPLRAGVGVLRPLVLELPQEHPLLRGPAGGGQEVRPARERGPQGLLPSPAPPPA